MYLSLLIIFFLTQKTVDPGILNKMFTRSGYLFLMEKKALGTTWNKFYCHYQREGRLFCMIPYNQGSDFKKKKIFQIFLSPEIAEQFYKILILE